MKNKVIFPILSLIGMLLMLTGCETTLTPQKGQRVRFAISSGRGLNTKTSYSGQEYTENGLKYERIDWVENEQIRIVSSDAQKVATPQGLAHYDYLITNVRANKRKSEADLADIANTNGLTWGSSAVEEVTFYGVYPPTTYGFITPTNGGEKYIEFTDMTIPANPTLVWDENTGKGNPDMTHAYMVSAPAQYNSQPEEGTKPIHLDFYPLFNAFEIDLASKDKTLALKKLELIAQKIDGTQSQLAGKFYYDMMGEDEPIVNNLQRQISADTSYSLSVNLTGKSISTSDHVHFTILAVPGDLTNITLAVTFVDPKNGADKTRYLKLQQNGSYITFPAFHKARLNGLAVDTGENWELTVKTDVNEWRFYSEKLSALDQINVAPVEAGDVHTVKVTGAIQTTPEWMAAHGGKSNDELPNDVPETDPSYYSRYYQVRTLNWNMPTIKHFFEMSFTPTAPIGGYWQMVPEAVGNQNSLDHFRFEVMIEGVTEFEEQETPHGQIMNRKVFVRIYPKDYSGDINVYEIIMKCYFSPNINFDPAYSADSELQDIHGNGQFSIWRFRLDSGATGNYSTGYPDNPDHDSDKL